MQGQSLPAERHAARRRTRAAGRWPVRPAAPAQRHHPSCAACRHGDLERHARGVGDRARPERVEAAAYRDAARRRQRAAGRGHHRSGARRRSCCRCARQWRGRCPPHIGFEPGHRTGAGQRRARPGRPGAGPPALVGRARGAYGHAARGWHGAGGGRARRQRHGARFGRAMESRDRAVAAHAADGGGAPWPRRDAPGRRQGACRRRPQRGCALQRAPVREHRDLRPGERALERIHAPAARVEPPCDHAAGRRIRAAGGGAAGQPQSVSRAMGLAARRATAALAAGRQRDRRDRRRVGSHPGTAAPAGRSRAHLHWHSRAAVDTSLASARDTAPGVVPSAGGHATGQRPGAGGRIDRAARGQAREPCLRVGPCSAAMERGGAAGDAPQSAPRGRATALGACRACRRRAGQCRWRQPAGPVPAADRVDLAALRGTRPGALGGRLDHGRAAARWPPRGGDRQRPRGGLRRRPGRVQRRQPALATRGPDCSRGGDRSRA